MTSACTSSRSPGISCEVGPGLISPPHPARDSSRSSTIPAAAMGITYNVNNPNTKDRSMLLCLGSLLLFVFAVFIVILSLDLAGLGPDHKLFTREKCVCDANTPGGSQAQIGERSPLKGDRNSSAAENRNVSIDVKLPQIKIPISGVTQNGTSQTTKAPEGPRTVVEGAEPPLDEDPLPSARSFTFHSYVGEDEEEDDEDKEVAGHIQDVPPGVSSCETEECAKELGRIVIYRRLSSDPCHDIPGHACGGLQDNPFLLPPDAYSAYLATLATISASLNVTSSNGPKRVWKQFLDACIAYPYISFGSKINTLRTIFKSIGDFYGQGDDENADGSPKLFDLTRPLAKLLAMDIAPLLDVSVEPSSVGDDSFYVLSVRPPAGSTLWPSALHSCNDMLTSCHSHSTEQTNSFLEVVEQAVLSLAPGLVDNVTLHDTLAAVQKNILTQEDMKSTEMTKMTVGQLEQSLPGLNWQRLFALISHREVGPETPLHLYGMPYFMQLFERMRIEPRHTYNALLAISAYDLYMRFIQPVDGLRQDHCIRLSATLMKDFAAVLYMETFNSVQIDNVTAQITHVYEESKLALSREVEQSSCLEQHARDILKNKLLNSTTLAIEIDYVRNLTWANLSTRLGNMHPGQGYIQDVLMWVRSGRSDMFSSWGQDGKNSDALWLSPDTLLLPSVTLIRQSGVVLVPLNFLGAGFAPSIPDYLIHARLGFSMSRALASLLDFTGAANDLKGNESVPDLQVYSDLAIQYSTAINVTLANISTVIKTSTTQEWNARLADDLALRAAFGAAFPLGVPRAAAGTSSTVHNFFLSLVQQTCVKAPHKLYRQDPQPIPDLFRIALALPAFSEFAKTFGCQRVDGDEAPVLCRAST